MFLCVLTFTVVVRSSRIFLIGALLAELRIFNPFWPLQSIGSMGTRFHSSVRNAPTEKILEDRTTTVNVSTHKKIQAKISIFVGDITEKPRRCVSPTVIFNDLIF